MFLGEEVPRRLRRFHRKMERGEDVPEEALLELEEEEIEEPESIGETIFKQVEGDAAGEAKKKAMELALREVKRFKKKHRRLPKKEEYDKIADSIFSQLKTEREKERLLRKVERAKGRMARKGKARKAAAKEMEKPLPRKKDISEVLQKIKGLDVKDLFEEQGEKPAKKAKVEGELSELSKLGLGEEMPKELPLEKEAEQQECPSCKAAAAELIYCPECGTAYCKKCAEKIEKLADRIKYYCPKCGKFVEK